MKDFIQFGSRRIEFNLHFKNRRTLGITVTPEMEVVVNAPLNASVAKIKEKIRKKARWIIKQKSYFLPYHPKTPPKKFVSGETHYYMGRQFKLSIRTGKKKSVHYKGRQLEVITPNKNKAKEMIMGWYKNHAKIKFAIIAQPILERFEKYGVNPKGIYVQEMRKRWGSCTKSGRIILNTELIKAPKGCIDYVIIHELCHLVHHNHGEAFLKLQKKMMPDWEKWKRKLEKEFS